MLNLKQARELESIRKGISNLAEMTNAMPSLRLRVLSERLYQLIHTKENHSYKLRRYLKSGRHL